MTTMTTTVDVVSDGIIKFDGGTMFGQVPKAYWESKIPTDRKNRITLGLNCLLVRLGRKTILIDAGVGFKESDDTREEYGLAFSKLMKGLRSMGVSAKDVDAVVLTHLHFDHSGGCTRVDYNGNVAPTFPNAKYFVQRASWEDACFPNERSQSIHRTDDFKPIEQNGQLELLDGDTEILPGLWVEVSDGHAKGHQIVLIRHGGERIAYLGDLVPTAHHLNLIAIPAYDQHPESTLEQKRELLLRAEKEGWLLVFPHGLDYKAGYLERWNGSPTLRPIDL